MSERGDDPSAESVAESPLSLVTVDVELPKGWTVASLGDIAELQLGRTPARANARFWAPGSVPWVSIADLKGRTVSRTRESISEEAFREVFHERLVPAGTVLMSFKLTIGKVGILAMPAVHNEAIVSISPDRALDRDFLFFVLQSLDFSRFLDVYAKGKTLNKEKLKRLPLPLPPLTEQAAIARALISVQRARLATDLRREALDVLYESLLHDLMSGVRQPGNLSVGG